MSSCYENEHAKVHNVEVLCREEDIYCNKDFDFSDFVTNDFSIVSSLSHPNNDQSQEDKTCIIKYKPR